MNEADIAKMSGEEKIHAIADALDLPKSREDMEDGTICQERPHKQLWEWDPLTDANARDEVVEAMAQKGWTVYQERTQYPQPHFRCIAQDVARNMWWPVTAESPGEAVVDACLLAIGGD